MNKLLKERMKKYRIPRIPYFPIFEKCICFRLPDEEEKFGGDKGFIIKPEISKRPKHRCLLLAGGLKALDHLYGYGVEVGDIVWVARYSGWEAETHDEVRRLGEAGKSILIVNSKAICGSEDLLDRDFTIVFDEETGQHKLLAPGKKVARPREDDPDLDI